MKEGEEDIEDQGYILKLLKEKGTLFTDQIVQALKEKKAEAASPDCNDRTMRNLISMKRQGIIKGKMNRENRTWEWSLG